MTIKYKEYAALKTVEIIVDGKVSEADFDRIMPQMKAFIHEHGKVKFIEIIKDLDGFEWGMLSKGIKFDLKYMSKFTHCAVVTDKGWIGPFARIMSPFFDIEIKTFKMSEESEARVWLEEAS